MEIRHDNIERIGRSISDSPMTISEIMEKTGLSKPCISRAIATLIVQKRVYIGDWRPLMAGKSLRHVAAYRFGDGVDKPRPARQSRDQKLAKKRLYSISKRELEKLEADRLERTRRELERPAFRDPFIAALFGPYEART